MSPIHNAENDRLYERIEHCSRSATRLNFTIDMSTDVTERKSSVNGYHSLGKFAFCFRIIFHYILLLSIFLIFTLYNFTYIISLEKQLFLLSNRIGKSALPLS